MLAPRWHFLQPLAGASGSHPLRSLAARFPSPKLKASAWGREAGLACCRPRDGMECQHPLPRPTKGSRPGS